MAKTTRIQSSTGDLTVETWYDWTSRNWITQIKDGEDQLGDAEFSGHKPGAMADHKYAVAKAWRIVDERETPEPTTCRTCGRPTFFGAVTCPSCPRED